MGKDLINVFHFDILNRIGKNPFNCLVKTIEPKFHHVSEFKEVIQKWGSDEHLGFDYESRNFPMQGNFRLLGFSLVNDTYQAYIYFSRDDSSYYSEMEEFGEDIIKFFSKNSKRFW